VGLFNLRIVKKDKNDTLPVFLHQDLGYQAGRFERYSLFIPLTYCGIKNGGLKFYPGTQNFGYLGDAGALNDFLPDNYPRVTPEAFPGDVIIMHSAVWHSSDENTSLADRIYYDIHVQDANDPSTKKVLTGERSSPWQLTLTHDEIFQSSRTQRLKELYSQINS
jgi:ectoine hydroxylase-related dioxygenase (phytanoyl-CoA dioxygenase family)